MYTRASSLPLQVDFKSFKTNLSEYLWKSVVIIKQDNKIKSVDCLNNLPVYIVYKILKYSEMLDRQGDRIKHIIILLMMETVVAIVVIIIYV